MEKPLDLILCIPNLVETISVILFFSRFLKLVSLFVMQKQTESVKIIVDLIFFM